MTKRWPLYAGAALALCMAAILDASIFGNAQAQYADMSCSDLWYARNKIYAENGHCFETERARRVFGRGCFPPYGRLSGYEQRQVKDIQYWEARKGCSS